LRAIRITPGGPDGGSSRAFGESQISLGKQAPHQTGPLPSQRGSKRAMSRPHWAQSHCMFPAPAVTDQRSPARPAPPPANSSEAECPTTKPRLPCSEAWSFWTAQQQGFVLRNNPLKQGPLTDHVFGRIAKADYGFRHLDQGGRKAFWYPEPTKVLSLGYEPEGAGRHGTTVIPFRKRLRPRRPSRTTGGP
jgi:hypothetical protein